MYLQKQLGGWKLCSQRRQVSEGLTALFPCVHSSSVYRLLTRSSPVCFLPGSHSPRGLILQNKLPGCFIIHNKWQHSWVTAFKPEYCSSSSGMWYMCDLGGCNEWASKARCVRIPTEDSLMRKVEKLGSLCGARSLCHRGVGLIHVGGLCLCPASDCTRVSSVCVYHWTRVL